MSFSPRLSDKAQLLIEKPKCFIDGSWQDGLEAPATVFDPATGDALLDVPMASPAQAQLAVDAARNAFDDGRWTGLSPEDRSRVLHRLADLMRDNRDELVSIFVQEGGCPKSLAESLNTDLPIEHLRWLADKAAAGPEGGWVQELDRHPWSGTAGLLQREPIGVVSSLCPYNVPYIAYVWKAGAALAAGCTTIIMPSPRVPLTAVAFTRLAEQAGVPPGVLNLILGGPEAGKVLTEADGVDMVTFTGSNAVGAMVTTQAAASAKRVVLELGGKSPNIVLPGVSAKDVVSASLHRLFRNAGQGCAVTSRTFVPREIYDNYAELAAEVVAEMKVGDPWEDDTWVGPLIRAEHRDRVEGFVQRAISGGAKILAGGGRPDIEKGYFMNPVLLGNVQITDEICQEEQFGPVGVLLPYDSLDEMIALANNTRYGLNANIWGEHDEAVKIAMKINSGNVTINGGGPLRPDVSFGGYKQSGNGTEMGERGFEEFLEYKHISWPVPS
ncbi:aldehyde dehydrogenase family protein [Ruegeria arenilitoris]|uniref:aldehyde dehydrogenase family protein n=1 Tax=Ruegeria arenilitoris TaxID=1173585 RepID=UPI00147DD276|nr:aldehyde dehydrogenase family protein [Ruegeria arenilitoris]